MEFLKLSLMKCGIGRWKDIMQLGLLPGKQVSQLYGATQRLLGIQSLAAYTGQRLDVDAIKLDNAQKPGLRKAGLLTWEGGKIMKHEREELQAEALHRYKLPAARLAEVDHAVASALATPGFPQQKGYDALENGLGSARNAEEDDIDAQVVYLQELKSDILRMLHDLKHVQYKQLDNVREQAAGTKAQGAPLPQEEILSEADALTHAQLDHLKPKADSCAAAQETLAPKQKRRRKAATNTGRSKIRVAKSVLQANLSQLKAMGYSERMAREALEETEGDFDRALEFLLASCT